MKLLPWPDQISQADYVTLDVKLTVALGAYGLLTLDLGEQVTVLTFAIIGMPALLWFGLGFVAVPYLTTKLLVLGVTRVPRAPALSLLVPLVGLLATPVGSNLEAYGVPVPWLSMQKAMSVADMKMASVQAMLTIGCVMGGLICGLFLRHLER